MLHSKLNLQFRNAELKLMQQCFISKKSRCHLGTIIRYIPDESTAKKFIFHLQNLNIFYFDIDQIIYSYYFEEIRFCIHIYSDMETPIWTKKNDPIIMIIVKKEANPMSNFINFERQCVKKDLKSNLGNILQFLTLFEKIRFIRLIRKYYKT